MKKLLIAIALCILLGAASVSALTVSSTASAGDDRQEASNPLAQGSADKDIYVTTTVTLTNDGTSTITPSLGTVSSLISGISSTALNITATFSPTTIAVNGTSTATLTIRVPENLDAVDQSTLDEKSFAVANVEFTGSDGSSAITQLSLRRENQLQIDKVRICANDRCKSLDDGDDFENLRPGDDLEMTIIVENKYSDSDSEDLEIEDVQLEFEIDDGDFDENDDEDLDDINADDTEEETFTFSVDDDVSDGTYDLIIRTVGNDENGALHGQEIRIDLEVERKTHDIVIRSSSVSPSTLSCDRKEGRATISISNIGKRDEDNVALELINDELGIRERLGDLQLDESDSRTESLVFRVPDNAKAGSYLLSARSYFLDTAQSDEKLLEITVPKCDENQDVDDDDSADDGSNNTGNNDTNDDAEKEALKKQIEVLMNQIKDMQQDNTQNNNNNGNTAGNTPTTTVRTRTTTSGSADATNIGYIIGLAVVVIIVLALLIFLLSRFMRSKEY